MGETKGVGPLGRSCCSQVKRVATGSDAATRGSENNDESVVKMSRRPPARKIARRVTCCSTPIPPPAWDGKGLLHQAVRTHGTRSVTLRQVCALVVTPVGT